MKNMKKLVALFAATVMTMSLSVSAFAAQVDSEGTPETTFDLVFTKDAADSSKDQLTMVAYLVADTVTEDAIPDFDGSQTIVAIDQVGGDSAGFGTVPVMVEKLKEGYAIAVAMGGSDGTVAKYLIKYNEEEETVEVLIADVNGDGSVNGDDAGEMVAYINNNLSHSSLPIGQAIGNTTTQLGDVNRDGSVNGDDAGEYMAFINSNLSHATLDFYATVQTKKN